MNKWIMCLLVAFTDQITTLQAETAPVIISGSTVSQVRIYTSGALVTRNGTAVLEPGTATVIFEHIPGAIDRNTVQVSGKGDFTIHSVSVAPFFLGPDRKSPELVRLEDSLDVLQTKRESILARMGVLQEEQNLILANKSIGGANTGVRQSDLLAMADFFRTRLTSIREDLLDLGSREKKLKKEIDKLSNQVNTLQSRKNIPSSVIEVSVQAASRTTASFELTYYTTQVSWQPGYDVRIRNLVDQAELQFNALVTQQTGEDWKDVRITFSTGNPAQGNQSPDLQPWYLSLLQPVAIRYETAPAYAKPESVMEGANGKQAGSTADYVTRSESSFSFEYEITIPYTIISSASPGKVKISSHQLAASYNLFAVPKLDPDVFIMASVTGWQQLGLLSGTCHVYYENSYTGETMLDAQTTGDTLKLSVGRDKRVVIKRERKADVAGNQLIGGNRIRTFTWEITVKNNRKDQVRLTLLEQVPVSTDKDVEVKIGELSGGALEEATGKITYDLTVPAAGQIKKTVGFSVKYPKDKYVSGL